MTGDLQRNWGWLSPSLDMRNLGTTPRFDVTAPLAARMWTALTGQPINGVIAIDVVGVRQLLEATGPVDVNGQEVSADNVGQYLLHDQYESLTDNAADAGDREDALGSLARGGDQPAPGSVPRSHRAWLTPCRGRWPAVT